MNQPTIPPAAPVNQTSWRRKRLLLMLAGAAAILTIGFVGAAGSRFSVARRELADAIAEADRLDPGWRLEELETQRRLPPAKQNAALQVLTVQSLLPPRWYILPASDPRQEGTDVDSGWHDLAPEKQIDDQRLRQLRALLARAGPALDQARKLAEMPEGRYPVAWTADVISTSGPWYPAVYSAELLLQLDALDRNQADDPDAALISARAILNVGRSLGDEPFLSGPVNHNWCRYQAARVVERTLAQGQPSESALAAVQQAAERQQVLPILLAHFRGTRAFMHVFLTRVDEGQNRLSEASCVPTRGLSAHAETWFGRVSALHKHARFLRGMNEAVEIAKLPLEQQFPLYREWRRQWGRIENVGDGLMLDIGPEEGLIRGHALLRCTLVGLAAERYRRKHGDWPRAIADLVPNFLHEVPLDPIDAAPLRYRRTDCGAVIYSVGRDGHDDAGDAKPAVDGLFPRDIVFTLWNVDRRRQPPKPPAPAVGNENFNGR